MKPRKRKTRRLPTPEEAQTPRSHGDAYDDVQARDDGLAATTSTHGVPTDRRAEEPSEAATPDVLVDGR